MRKYQNIKTGLLTDAFTSATAPLDFEFILLFLCSREILRFLFPSE